MSRAEHDTSASQRDLDGLAAVASALARTPTVAAAIEAVVSGAMAMLGAVTGAVGLRTEEGDAIRLVGFAGLEVPAYTELAELPLDAPYPAVRVARMGEPEWIGSREEMHALYPATMAAPGGAGAIHAIAGVPLLLDGRILGVLAMGFDAPRRFDDRDRRLLAILAQACALALERVRLRDAERAALLRDEHVARVSHELRTPLAAMRMWIQVLRAGRAEERRAAIEAIEKGAVSQSKLIDDLLDLARGMNGKLRIDEQIVDLRAPIEEAVSVMRPDAEAKSILLLTAIASDAGLVRGDPDRLQQVVVNLLSNAIKFTPRGGRIEVLLRTDARDVVLSVRDTGAGIDPEALEAVFAPFEQQGGDASAGGGLGLGLTIARHVVDLHGGSIHAESAGADAGATLVVKLPRAADGHAGAPVEARRAEVTRASLLAGVRALVVEDQGEMREAIAIMLRRFGAIVMVAASASEGMEVLRKAPISVIVSDIAMPGEDGLSFMRRARGLGVTTPAVALTAQVRPEDVAAAIAAGFQAHMAKPFSAQDLAWAVARLTSREAGVPRYPRLGRTKQ